MIVNHHVLLRFNKKATKETCLLAARELDLPSEVIDTAIKETDLVKIHKIIYGAILDKICALKDIINSESSTPIIYEARWSENEATIEIDKALTEKHGVTHKIEMTMKDSSAVETYFSHTKHMKLVQQFAELESREDSIFCPGGFAIPYDTKRPMTPRTLKDIILETGSLPFTSAEEAVAWATPFLGGFRYGGFPIKEDLIEATKIIALKAPEIAIAIRAKF